MSDRETNVCKNCHMPIETDSQSESGWAHINGGFFCDRSMEYIAEPEPKS